MKCRSCVIGAPVQVPFRTVGQGDRVGDEWHICSHREGTTAGSKDATDGYVSMILDLC